MKVLIFFNKVQSLIWERTSRALVLEFCLILEGCTPRSLCKTRHNVVWKSLNSWECVEIEYFVTDASTSALSSTLRTKRNLTGTGTSSREYVDSNLLTRLCIAFLLGWDFRLCDHRLGISVVNSNYLQTLFACVLHCDENINLKEYIDI